MRRRAAQRNPAGEPEPAQSGRRQHQRIVLALVQLAQARVEIAANRRETARRETTASAARCAGRCWCRSTAIGRAQRRASSTVVGRWLDSRAASAVTGSTTASSGSSRGRTRGDRQPSGSTRRHVLAAVHREIDVAAQQRILDFLHEQPLSANLRERRVLQAIAGRLDDRRSGTAGRPPAAIRAATVVRLPQGELAAARAESKFRGHASLSAADRGADCA